MAEKKLKLWNGRGYCCRNYDDKRWENRMQDSHAFVAAYSRADARRVIEEYCGRLPADSEIRDYWHAGSWGNAMEGVTPERGLWISFSRNKPERVL